MWNDYSNLIKSTFDFMTKIDTNSLEKCSEFFNLEKKKKSDFTRLLTWDESRLFIVRGIVSKHSVEVYIDRYVFFLNMRIFCRLYFVLTQALAN